MKVEDNKPKIGILPETFGGLLETIKKINTGGLDTEKVDILFGRISALLPQMSPLQREALKEEFSRQFPEKSAVKPIEK